MSFNFLKKVSHNGPSIHFNKLNLQLGKTEILSDITFTVESGTIHAIIGPNGGGKTSLLRSLLGEMPHSGEIAIEWSGKSQIIGYVPQFITATDNIPLTVMDFMAISIQKRPAFFGVSKNYKEIILTTLSSLGIADKSNKRLSTLSGGERQRVLIAQALIPAPELLILDEPMSSIDTAGAELFEKLLETLKEINTTVLLIHHDLKQVKQSADTVTCINKNLIFSGATDSVMDEKHLLEIFSSTHSNGEAN